MKKCGIVSIICLCLLLFLLVGCTESVESSADVSRLSDFEEFVEIPCIRQGTTYSCGIAALHSLLRWASYDLDVNDEYLMEACGTTPETGTNYEKLMDYMEQTGLLEVTWMDTMTADDIKSSIQDGCVVMIPIQAWASKETDSGEMVWFESSDYEDYWDAGHWVIACGYNDQNALFMDPSTAGTYTQMSWEDLELRWHDSDNYVNDATPFNKVDHCGMIVSKTGTETYDHEVVMPLQ